MNNSTFENISVPLKDIFIGFVDGETEAQESNFEDLFYTENSKYDEILTPNKFIISGRKGTGKTILANYIEKKLNSTSDNFCKICTLKDFKLQQLTDLNYRNLIPDEFSLFWKWVILIELSKIILKCHPIKSKIPGLSHFKLKNFINKKYDNKLFKLSEYSSNKTSKNADKFDIKLTPTKAQASSTSSFENVLELNKHYKPKEYYELLNTLNSLVFKCLNKSKNITLIYDDLDELEGKIEENKFYRKLIISLLETVKELNIQIQKNTNSSSKVIILIRDDIIDSLHEYSTNLNKLTTNGKVQLYWISKKYNSPEEHPLMDLILTKIQKSVPQYSLLSKKNLYNKLFPKKINKKNIINYMLDYSFGRPRDIISYLNIIKEEYKTETYFDPDFFKSCQQDYSNWFYDELLNELSIHEDSKFIKESLELIKNFKKITFNYEMIKNYYDENKDLYPNIDNLKKALKYMYKFGVIGNSWKVRIYENKTQYRFSWAYRKDADNDPDFSKSFVIHYGFRKKFSI